MNYQRTDRAAQKRARFIRWSVLGFVLVLMTGLVTAHQLVTGAGKPASVDALCPFGGLETLFSLIAGMGLVQRTAASGLVLLLGTVVLGVVFRRSFCGQICPLGALQGIFGSLGRRLRHSRPQIPRGLDRIARYLKYAVLAFFVLWTWQAATLVMRPYDPWVAFAHVTSPELMAEFGVGVAILVLSLVGSLVYERFFCKYLCPIGAFLGILSRFSAFGVKRDLTACVNCSACDVACPMNIEVSAAERVTSAECISCGECVNACPASGALQIESRSGRRVSPALMTGIVVALIAAVIVASTAAGAFAWTMPSLGQAVEQQGTAKGSETFDTSLIKGYMSLAEISEATGVPPERFTQQWGVPQADLDKPMKDIKDKYGFSPEDVRAWVEAQPES